MKNILMMKKNRKKIELKKNRIKKINEIDELNKISDRYKQEIRELKKIK